MKCGKCGKKVTKKTGFTPEGFEYDYFSCECGEEIVDMKQLHEVAQKYREMKKYHAKISKWGESLGIRIPKELTKKYNLKQNSEITLIPEKKSIKLVV
jgi:hypothetical protein